MQEDNLPTDGLSILALAARSMVQLFSSGAQGMFVVDRGGRMVWVNESCKRFLPALGFSSVDEFVGQLVEEVIPNTGVRAVLETGQPVLVDLLTNRAGTFVVSRIPLRDERSDELIGALGIVLFDHPEPTLQPLIDKFSLLQRDLDEARRELASQRRNKYTLTSFVGASPAAVQVKRQARRAAQSASPVLLFGESGTGKELLAHAIHAASARAAGPLVSVNVAAIPDMLLDAELFGVAPGGLTSQDRPGRHGKFRLADCGTLFLHEIGDLPLSLQPKLLRALQEGKIETPESNTVIACDARVIAATSRDLAALVRQGKFSEELFHRLNVLPIRVPALRERRGDIGVLVKVLAEDMALRSGSAPFELGAEAMALLSAQEWRGNVRELRNVLEHAAVRADSSKIGVMDLEAVLRESGIEQVEPVSLAAVTPGLPQRRSTDLRPLAEQVSEVERQAIKAAMAYTRGNKFAAAKLLGISRAKLYERLEGLPEHRASVSNSVR